MQIAVQIVAGVTIPKLLRVCLSVWSTPDTSGDLCLRKHMAIVVGPERGTGESFVSVRMIGVFIQS